MTVKGSQIASAMGLSPDEALCAVADEAFVKGMEFMADAMVRGIERASRGTRLDEVVAARAKVVLPDVTELLLSIPTDPAGVANA